MSAQVLAFGPAYERRRARTAAGALAGEPLYLLPTGTRAHAIRYTFPRLNDGATSVILRCGRHVLLGPFQQLEPAPTTTPCQRCARSTIDAGIPVD